MGSTGKFRQHVLGPLEGNRPRSFHPGSQEERPAKRRRLADDVATTSASPFLSVYTQPVASTDRTEYDVEGASKVTLSPSK